MAPLLRLAGIGKRYGAVEALSGVDLEIAAGEVVAICGDNGAGKSTLIRIVSGAHEPSQGTIELDGRAVVFSSPIDALKSGIATIYQDLALAPRLPIWQNVFVGAELTRRLAPGVRVLDKRAMREASSGYLTRLKVDVRDTDRPVERLSGESCPEFEAFESVADRLLFTHCHEQASDALAGPGGMNKKGPNTGGIHRRVEPVVILFGRVVATEKGLAPAPAATGDDFGVHLGDQISAVENQHTIDAKNGSECSFHLGIGIIFRLKGAHGLRNERVEGRNIGKFGLPNLHLGIIHG